VTLYIPAKSNNLRSTTLIHYSKSRREYNVQY
jgi:hypothetical protein